jgi:hypothetical protein
MSKHNRSPNLLGQDSKCLKASHTSNMSKDVFDDPRTNDVEMQDSPNIDSGDSTTPYSLDKVLDNFDSNDHVRYDREVNKQMGGEFQGIHRYTILLLAIVGNCGEKLDVKYKDFQAANAIIDEKPDLKTELETAWSLQKYRGI